MTDISISIDETIEIIYNVSEDTSELDFLTIKKEGENINKEDWDEYNVKNIHKFTWTPPKEGNYTLNVNGEDISIEVNEIPDDVLYNEGVGEDNWVEGDSANTGSVSKESNHLLAVGGPDTSGNAYRSWVTSEPVDLEFFDTIRVEMAADGDASNWGSYGVCGSGGTRNEAIKTQRPMDRSDFSRQDFTLDISDINDEHHLGFHARDGAGALSRQVDVLLFVMELIE